MKRITSRNLLILVGLFATMSVAAQTSGTLERPAPNDLLELTRVSDVRLTLTAGDYAALAPAVQGGSPFGGFGRGNWPPPSGMRPSEPTAGRSDAPAGRLGGPPEGFRPPTGFGAGRSFLLGAEGKRNGLASAMGIDFQYVHADVTIGGTTLKNIGLRYKGNGTYLEGMMSGKVSLKLDFNRFVKGQKLGTFKTLNLHSNITDASFMNEPLAFRMYRDAGVAAPRTSYGRVFMTVTGEPETRYLGLYSIVENPDEPFLVARGLPQAGAIFKPVTTSLFADLGADWAKYNQIYDPKTDLTDAQRQRVIDLARLVTSADDRTFSQRIGDYIDLDAIARFLAVNVYLSDMDGILRSGQNYYIYLHPQTNRFSFFAWDQDHSWGQFFVASRQQREDLDILHPWVGENRFLARLFAVESFLAIYLQRMNEFSRTIFAEQRVVGQVDEVGAAIRSSVAQEDAARLRRFDQAVRGETPSREAADGGRFGGFGGFGPPNPPIKPFVRARLQSVVSQLQLAAKP
jgi:spore coat protein H